MSIIPVIISGGAGARLWPLSRESYPKPFVSLPDGLSLLQHTLRRAASLPDVSEIITVTNVGLLSAHQTLFQNLGIVLPSISYLLEPEGRDTAAAIASATLFCMEKHGADAHLCVMPADHVIEGQQDFIEAMVSAKQFAEDGRLVTFGINPTRPEIGYGYIKSAGNDVLQFVEKPDLKTAQEYLEDGNYFWNSGIFCFQAGTMISLMEEHCSDILSGCRNSLAKADVQREARETLIRLDKDAFATIEKLSIDYAVLEKTSNISVIRCDIGWSDFGTWDAYGTLLDGDQQGNRFSGDTELHSTKDSVIFGEERLIATVGVENLVVIDTPDALLVADKSRVSEVKILYNELKKNGHAAHKVHKTVYRPWGSFTVLEDKPSYKVKRLEVNPGGRLSLQSHNHRSEHWTVVGGIATATNGEELLTLHVNQSTYIACGSKHRLENLGQSPVAIIEVQLGDYLEEDDIVRYSDIYGRF